MRIEYFETDHNNIIYRKYIDTDDKNYIRHDDNYVEFKEFNDGTPYFKSERLIKHRNYNVIKQQLIEELYRKIKNLSDELVIFETVTNYDKYQELIYKDK